MLNSELEFRERLLSLRSKREYYLGVMSLKGRGILERAGDIEAMRLVDEEIRELERALEGLKR